MKIALVGIGKIAVDEHVPAISDSPDWELAATVSREGAVDGVEAFTDLGAMLEARPDIRVVSLCLPPVPRFAYAMQAIAAGRHVMLEKPPGATLAECHALERAARAAGLTLYTTWHSRAAEMVGAAKAWLEDKTLTSLTVTWKEDVRRWHSREAILREDVWVSSHTPAPAKASVHDVRPPPPPSPSREITTFAWDDGDKVLKLYLSLGQFVDELCSSDVVVRFSSGSVRVRVGDLTFERKLFAPVKPSKCGFKVNEERRVVEGQSKNGFFPVEERDKVDVFIFIVGVYVVVVRKTEIR